MERCLICQRKLKDTVSMQRGIGPVCWERLAKIKKVSIPKKPIKVANEQISMFKEG